MSHSFQDLIYKINYIEAEIEIQKQILFSLSDNEKDEMEKIIGKISEAQQQIQQVRSVIESDFPQEHKHIVQLERATESFKQLSKEKSFIKIENSTPIQNCHVTLNNGDTVDCLIKAHEANGNVTVITLDGTITTYNSSDIQN